MRRNKSLWYLAVMVLVFAVTGSFLGEFLSGWVPLLGNSQSMGFKIPINLTLNVVDLEFLLSLSLRINLLSVVGMLLGVYIYYNK